MLPVLSAAAVVPVEVDAALIFAVLEPPRGAANRLGSPCNWQDAEARGKSENRKEDHEILKILGLRKLLALDLL